MSVQYSLEHIGLAARDTVALKDWYLATLGAHVLFNNGQTPPAFFLKLPGGALIEIYEGDFGVKEISDNAMHGWRHLALRVDSIPTAKAELESRGVKFDQPVKPAGGGGRVLFFRDPEGNLLHLVERPADSIFKMRA